MPFVIESFATSSNVTDVGLASVPYVRQQPALSSDRLDILGVSAGGIVVVDALDGRTATQDPISRK